MGGTPIAADSRLDTPAGAEVMQLERQLAFRVIAGALKELPNRLLGVPADCGDRDRIPDTQQQHFQIRGRPDRHSGRSSWISHEGIVGRDHGAFGGCR